MEGSTPSTADVVRTAESRAQGNLETQLAKAKASLARARSLAPAAAAPAPASRSGSGSKRTASMDTAAAAVGGALMASSSGEPHVAVNTPAPGILDSVLDFMAEYHVVLILGVLLVLLLWAAYITYQQLREQDFKFGADVAPLPSSPPPTHRGGDGDANRANRPPPAADMQPKAGQPHADDADIIHPERPAEPDVTGEEVETDLEADAIAQELKRQREALEKERLDQAAAAVAAGAEAATATATDDTVRNATAEEEEVEEIDEDSDDDDSTSEEPADARVDEDDAAKLVALRSALRHAAEAAEAAEDQDNEEESKRSEEEDDHRMDEAGATDGVVQEDASVSRSRSVHIAADAPEVRKFTREDPASRAAQATVVAEDAVGDDLDPTTEEDSEQDGEAEATGDGEADAQVEGAEQAAEIEDGEEEGADLKDGEEEEKKDTDSKDGEDEEEEEFSGREAQEEDDLEGPPEDDATDGVASEETSEPAASAGGRSHGKRTRRRRR